MAAVAFPVDIKGAPDNEKVRFSSSAEAHFESIRL